MIRSTSYLVVLTAICAAFAYAAGTGLHPVVFNVTPTTASPAGGTVLTIFGDNFGPASMPLVGGIQFTNATVVNPTTIKAITPPLGGAGVPIVVTGGDGSVSDPFRGFSFDKPIIFNVTPTSGRFDHATVITLIGKNFGRSGSVFVGRNQITVFNYTDIQVFGKVEPGTGRDLPIRIHDDFGQFSNPFIGFTYRRPRIDSVFPINGTRLGGTAITIIGSDFGSVGNVTIGPRYAPVVNYTDTEIVALSPPGSSDTPDIMVMPAGGEPGDPFAGFTYQPCPAGYFDPQNSGECRPCRPGSYSAVTGAESCTPCLPGTVQPGFGKTECVPCQPGRFQSQIGQTTCEMCDAGTAAPVEGMPLCQPCAPGSYQPGIGEPTCDPCPPGTATAESGQIECMPCDRGTVAPGMGNLICKQCPEGFVQILQHQETCDPCAPGTFQPRKGQISCLNCAPGTFQSQPGQAACEPCPLGSYQLEPGADACLNCDQAPAEFQVDFDGDGLIDICDPDSDDDGVPDKRDRCIFTPLTAAVDASGGSLGDADRDCDTDLEDIRDSTNGFTGPLVFPVDCVVSEFGQFSECSASCGGGISCRTREVLQEPLFGGQPCPALEECVPCNEQPCPVDCVVSEWGPFSSCSAPCDGGTQCRTRSIVAPAQFGGLPCPALQECRACNTDPCL